LVGAFVDELEGAAAAGDDVEVDAGLVGAAAEGVGGQGGVVWGDEGELLGVATGELLADFLPGAAGGQAAHGGPVVGEQLGDDAALLLGVEVGIE